MFLCCIGFCLVSWLHSVMFFQSVVDPLSFSVALGILRLVFHTGIVVGVMFKKRAVLLWV